MRTFVFDKRTGRAYNVAHSKMDERNDLFSYNLLTPRGKGYYYGKENET